MAIIATEVVYKIKKKKTIWKIIMYLFNKILIDVSSRMGVKRDGALAFGL